MIPHTVPPRYPPTAAARLASRIVLDPARAASATVAILGLPDDTGVRLNSGRPGAAGGPQAFRTALAAYGVAEPAGRAGGLPGVFDAGDVTPGESLDATHARVTAAAAALLEAGLILVGIGGGHDLTFPLVRAACERLNVRTGLYVDPHLDVRPEPGSGMAFRALVERCGVRRLYNAGMQPLVTAAEHESWFRGHGGVCVTLDQARRLLRADDDRDEGADIAPLLGNLTPHRPEFVSIDLDSIDASQAPGVSALNPCGFQVQQLTPLVQAAGAAPQVRVVDFMELNPQHDIDGRTARVAAHLFLHFLLGVASRR